MGEKNDSGANVASAELSLNKFLIENDELDQLSARLSGFNPFSVLRIEHAELRHSNVLSWLLAPSENHGFGDLFLRGLLARIIQDNEMENTQLTATQAALMPLDDTTVDREWHHIDIVARSRSHRWCLLIENKVRSRESKGQLKRYRQIVDAEMRNWQVIPVLLTLDGDDPSEEAQNLGYVGLSYGTVLGLLERLLRQQGDDLSRDAHSFVEHYCEVLRRLTMQDDELVELCRTIYRKHKEAIDLIVDYGASSQVLDGCLDFAEHVSQRDVVEGPAINRIWLSTADLTAAQREVGSGWKFLPKRIPVIWWYYHRKGSGKIQLSLEVGPVEDSEQRVRILESLREGGFSFRDAAFRETAKYTRVHSVAQSLGKDEDGEPDTSFENARRVASLLWTKVEKERKQAVDALRTVDWGRSKSA